MDECELRLAAIQTLGEKRAAQAAPLLTERLTSILPISVDNYLSIRGTYPAGDALVQIGEPAVAPLKASFEATQDRRNRLVYLFTLMRIDGKKGTVEYLCRLQKLNQEKFPEDEMKGLVHWVESFEGM